jgi:hypothetical protein
LIRLRQPAPCRLHTQRLSPPANPQLLFTGFIDPFCHRLIVFEQEVVVARSDDYFFGVLHPRLHERWSLALGTSLEDRPRYTPTTTFETFPFPRSPGKEPKDDRRVQAIAQAAKELVEQRDRWLNAEGLGDAEKKKRTLANLYNQRPTWLEFAHKRLNQAVFAAYGWKADLSDEEILEKLLALNLEKSMGGFSS